MQDIGKKDIDKKEPKKNALPKTNLLVKQMMNKKFKTLSPEDSLKTVVEYFQKYKIDILPVVNEKDELIAVFPKTRLYKALLEATSIDQPCKDYMVGNPMYVTEDQEYNPESLVSRVTHSPVSNVVVLNKDGKVCGTIGTAEYLQESLNVITASSAILESMFRVNYDGVILIDRHGNIIRVNPAAEKMFKIDFNDVAGKALRDILPEIKMLYRPGIPSEASSGQHIRVRLTVNSLPVLVSRMPIVENGEQIGASFEFQDISDMERIAQELEIVKEMKATIDEIINTSSDGVIVSDLNGVIKYVNEKTAILMQKSHENITGLQIQKLLHTKSPAKSVTSETPVVDTIVINGKQCIVSHRSYRSKISNESSGIISTIYLSDSVVTEDMAKRWFDINQKIRYYQSALEKNVDTSNIFNQIVTTNPHFVNIKRDAQRIARSSSTVLLTGESGVGKSMFARGIHEVSPRSQHPFVVVNCVSIPETLFESELFGYAPGSFTGALKTGKSGYFERADKGTIFLDEIGEIPMSIQGKLLQVLQDKEFERVGSTEKQSVDVRIIAATNRDLRDAINNKLFREDLYYRLNVIEFNLPSLRDRSQDIVPLAVSFISKYNKMLGSKITGISERARKVLREYDWPGNIRELENAIEHGANYVWEGVIDVENLPSHIMDPQELSSIQKPYLDYSEDKPQIVHINQPIFPVGEVAESIIDDALNTNDSTNMFEVESVQNDSNSYRNARFDFERDLLLDALKKTNGNKSAAAKLMNLSRSAFYERLQKYKIQP